MSGKTIAIVAVSAAAGYFLFFYKSTPGTAIPPGGIANGVKNNTGATLYLTTAGSIVTAGNQIVQALTGPGQPTTVTSSNVSSATNNLPDGTYITTDANGYGVYADGNGGYYNDLNQVTDAIGDVPGTTNVASSMSGRKRMGMSYGSAGAGLYGM